MRVPVLHTELLSMTRFRRSLRFGNWWHPAFSRGLAGALFPASALVFPSFCSCILFLRRMRRVHIRIIVRKRWAARGKVCFRFLHFPRSKFELMPENAQKVALSLSWSCGASSK